MSYLYETHLHTVWGSSCAVSRGPDYLSLYRDQGYTGIFVTDHFYNGNTAVDRALPWAEWVAEFCRGYEETREAGDKIGLDVFFGWEETFDGDDYLVYGLDRAWLLKHGEARRWTRAEQAEAVRAAGGCVVQAHPFRAAAYISAIHLFPALVDAVETGNRANAPAWDVLAARYARQFGLPETAGSDIHSVSALRSTEAAYGVFLQEKLSSAADYAKIIRSKAAIGLRTAKNRFQDAAVQMPCIPVNIHGAVSTQY
ncbi:MAG: PHP domain-containing protein [Spirochaetaceae bacterium]|jgi:hypothetical protein|nr:PHP domain-containing protein [Spirochaetaceae bacterium]